MTDRPRETSSDASSQSLANLQPEIDQLRERLAFYESFDQIIQENVSKAGGLLREAAQVREEARASLVAAEERAAQLANRERLQYRSLFSSVLDQITVLQGQLERLARDVGDALDDLESDLPTGQVPSGQQTPILSAAVTPHHHETAPAVTSEDMDVDESADVDAVAPAAGGFEADDLIERGALEEQPEPEPLPTDYGLGDAAIAIDIDDVADEPGFDRFTAAEELPDEIEDVADDLPPDLTADEISEPVAIDTTVIAHGVPRATMALALKRYLEGLPQVSAVEPREYAEGMLRMHVTGTRNVTLDDIRSWPECPGLTPVENRTDWVEFRLSR